MAQLYTIDSQKTVTKAVPGGGFTRVVEVYFTAHPSEQASVVDIPADAYTPAAVTAAVTPAAETLNAVQAL